MTHFFSPVGIYNIHIQPEAPDLIWPTKGPQPRKVKGVRLNDVRQKPEKKSETLKRLLKQKGRK